MKKSSLLFFIARRYLFARKSFAIINIISAVSVIGVAVGTMALVVVLSVFNGFEDLILGLFNNFHSDFKIENTTGKTFHLADFPENEIRELEEVNTLTYVIEDMALARYNDRQHLVMVKAVSEDFLSSANLDSIIVRGDAILEYDSAEYAILGAGVDYVLGINPNDYTRLVSLYVPARKSKASVSLSAAFVSETVHPAGVFSVQQEYDETYILIPYITGKRLYDYEDEVTSVEIMLHQGHSMKKVSRKLKDLLGDQFVVSDRFQQQEFVYKILRSEKLAIIMILAFILIIATFNVIGTLSMIILEKRKDIGVLSALGAPLGFIRSLFIVEGMLIICIGAFFGILLGYFLCLLQIRYGLIGLGGEDAGFVVQAYPVKIRITDLLIVFSTVGVIGILTMVIPSGRIDRKFVSMNEHIAENEQNSN
jgi:lipoprotein-releasing system permease protein